MPGVIGVSGVGALQIDYLKAVYGNFPLMLGLIVLITYVLLVRAFRSLLLPLKAVILNLVSVSAVFGAMVLFWQDGHGSQAMFGIAPTGAITFWLPIMVFAFLFGLSMDYEVFILSRMREEYDAHGRHRRRRRRRSRPDRPAGDQRGADPVPRVHLAGERSADRHQAVRHGARLRHPAGRDGRPGAAGAGAGQPVRRVELVPAGLGRQGPARAAVARAARPGPLPHQRGEASPEPDEDVSEPVH